MASSSSSRLEPRSLDEILDDDKLEYRPPSHTVPDRVANDPLRKIKVDLMAVLNASQKPMSALAIERDYAEVNGRRVDPSEFGYDSMEKLLANCDDSIRTIWKRDGSLEYTVVPNERTARLRLQVEQQMTPEERERRKARAEGRPYCPPRKNLPVSESSEDVNDSCYDFMIPMTPREEEKCAKLTAMNRSRSTSVNSEAMADRNHPHGKNGVTFLLAPFVLAGTLPQSKSEFATTSGDPGDNHQKEVFTPSPFSDKKIAIIIDLIEEYGVKRATGDVQIEISKLRQLYKSRCGTSLAGGEFSARITADKMAQLPDAPWQIEIEPSASRTGRDVYLAVVKKEEYGNRGGLAVPLPAMSPILKSSKKKGDQLEPTQPHMQQLKVLKYRALAATNLKALRNYLGFTKQNGNSPSSLRIERRVRFREPEEVREKRESEEEERLAEAEEEEEETKTPADNEQGIRESEPRLDEDDSEDSMVLYEEETSSAEKVYSREEMEEVGKQGAQPSLSEEARMKIREFAIGRGRTLPLHQSAVHPRSNNNYSHNHTLLASPPSKSSSLSTSSLSFGGSEIMAEVYEAAEEPNLTEMAMLMGRKEREQTGRAGAGDTADIIKAIMERNQEREQTCDSSDAFARLNPFYSPRSFHTTRKNSMMMRGDGKMMMVSVLHAVSPSQLLICDVSDHHEMEENKERLEEKMRAFYMPNPKKHLLTNGVCCRLAVAVDYHTLQFIRVVLLEKVSSGNRAGWLCAGLDMRIVSPVEDCHLLEMDEKRFGLEEAPSSVFVARVPDSQTAHASVLSEIVEGINMGEEVKAVAAAFICADLETHSYHLEMLLPGEEEEKRVMLSTAIARLIGQEKGMEKGKNGVLSKQEAFLQFERKWLAAAVEPGEVDSQQEVANADRIDATGFYAELANVINMLEARPSRISESAMSMLKEAEGIIRGLCD